MVGYKYGVLRWSKTGSKYSFFILCNCHLWGSKVCNSFFLVEKTVEGTAAGITSVLAACSVLLPLLASTGYIFTEVSISFSVYSFCVLIIRMVPHLCMSMLASIIALHEFWL